jgi:hypothetical protein
MNERIKELAAKSNFGHMENGEVVYDHRLEKFAELIVAECANELIKWKNEPFPYDPEFGAKLIKDHFGVKE